MTVGQVLALQAVIDRVTTQRSVTQLDQHVGEPQHQATSGDKPERDRKPPHGDDPRADTRTRGRFVPTLDGDPHATGGLPAPAERPVVRTTSTRPSAARSTTASHPNAC